MPPFAVSGGGGGSANGPRATLRVEWLTDLASIEGLREPWVALESRVDDRTVYVTYDYLTSWYQAYASTRYTDFGEPLVGAVWWETTLVGIAPLISSRSTLAGIPVRALSLAGYNLNAGELLVLDDDPEIFEALLRSLVNRRGWDVLVLSNVPSAARRLRIIQDASSRVGLRWKAPADHSYAIADLRDGYEAYATVRGSNFRKQARRYAKKVADAGVWRVDRLHGVPPPSAVSRYLARMFAIAEGGWRARERGVDEERQHQPFPKLLLQKFAPRGMVDLSIIAINGLDAAFTLALVEHGTYFQVGVAYVETMAAFSPGSFLLQEVYRILPALGIHTVVSHGDYEYKRRWASRFVPTTKMLLFSHSVRGVLSWFAKFKLQPAWIRFRARARIRGPEPVEDSK